MFSRGLTVLSVAVLLAACGPESQPASHGGLSSAGTGTGFGSAGTVASTGFAGTGVTTPTGFAGTSGLVGSSGTGLPGLGAAGAPAAPGGGAKPPTMSAGTGATMAPGAAGTGVPNMPPPAAAGAAAPPPPPANVGEPVVPAMPMDCPDFKNGNITYGGLGGIEVVAGKKASGPTAPMLFYWHGTGSFSGEYATMAAAVQQGIVQEGGVLISFQDTTGGDLLSGTAIFGMGDLNLTDQLFACAVKNFNIDPHRVFATGCSAGGLMSVSMATLRSSYMAAAASNSGGWTVPLQFQNKHVPALMTVHGAPGVDVVIIDFSESSATADQGFKAAGGFVINCNHGGGHCGGGGLAGDIWTFFKAHPFGVTPEPWTALPAGFSGQCKIYM